MNLIDDTARTVLRSISGAAAVTLEGGYAVGGANPDGTGRTFFEQAAMSDVRRNKSDRCTHAIATYKDGSRLTFTWSPTQGPRYKHQAAPRPDLGTVTHVRPGA